MEREPDSEGEPNSRALDAVRYKLDMINIGEKFMGRLNLLATGVLVGSIVAPVVFRLRPLLSSGIALAALLARIRLGKVVESIVLAKVLFLAENSHGGKREKQIFLSQAVDLGEKIVELRRAHFLIYLM